MVSYKTSKRRRNSKRYKRRSLKRKNVKSRKVMRGGADDPLLGIEKGALVSIDLVVSNNPKGWLYKQGIRVSVVCRVLSVTEASGETKKTVKLRITNETFKFCNSSEMNEEKEIVFNENNGTPCSEEFEIIYDPDQIEMDYPYYFKNVVKNREGKIEIFWRKNTYVKEEGKQMDTTIGYKISKVVRVGVAN